MKCKIVKLAKFSGSRSSIYSIVIKNGQATLFDIFVKECLNSHKSEIKNILSRIYTIGHNTGARHSFFKHNEGVREDGVVALYDDPDKKLRLYGIRYGTDIVILGGGGPKNVRALQDDPKLKSENYLLRAISAEMTKKIRDGEIYYSSNNLDFEGELEFNI